MTLHRSYEGEADIFNNPAIGTPLDMLLESMQALSKQRQLDLQYALAVLS